jgi:hypothetical protein
VAGLNDKYLSTVGSLSKCPRDSLAHLHIRIANIVVTNIHIRGGHVFFKFHKLVRGLSDKYSYTVGSPSKGIRGSLAHL